MKGAAATDHFFFQRCHNIEIDQRTDKEGCLPDQKNHFVPVHKVLISITACHKRVYDLEIEDKKEQRQDFIFRSIAPSGNKKEH